MNYQYYICDVFTERRFGGNQLAVLPKAQGLTKEQMPGTDYLYARVHHAALRRILEREEPEFMD